MKFQKNLFYSFHKKLLMIAVIPLLILSMFGLAEKPAAAEEVYKVPPGSENWPGFRGVNGSGLTENQDLPLNWDIKNGTNIKWVYKTPGLGLSSPVIWGDKVFITLAATQEKNPSLKVGLYGDVDSIKNNKTHTWTLVCLNRNTGKTNWTREAYKGIPKVKRHPKSSHANSSPATDGKHVVAFFGSEGLYCYDFKGKLLWKKNFGLLDSGFYMMPEAQWEFGSSPVIHKGVVFVQCDVQKNSFLAALDITNGKTIWKTERDEVPTWSTPTIYEGKERTQVIVNGYKHIGSYDSKTGKPIWWFKGGGDIPVPTPVLGFDHVFITNAHGRMRPVYAVNLDAVGDITLKKKENSNRYITWCEKRKGAYIPTPLIYGDYLYICRNNGLLACLDAKTGKQIYKERIARLHSAYTASPVAADGKLYFADEYGNVHIIEAGPVYKHLASNKLGESCLASPSISGNMLFVRTIGHLFAIGKGGRTKGIETRKEISEPGEKIDLESIKTDGSLTDFEEITKIVEAKFKTVGTVKYDAVIKGVEALESSFVTFNFSVSLKGFVNGLPEYFLVNGESKGSSKVRKFTAGSDGYKYFMIDHIKKTVKSDIEMNALGAGLRDVYAGLVVEFVSNEPLSMYVKAEKKSLKGIKKINGEDCYELSFAFPKWGNYEVTWYFSIKDFFPRAQTKRFTMRDGKRGGTFLTIKNLIINPALKPEVFKLQEIADYKKLENKE